VRFPELGAAEHLATDLIAEEYRVRCYWGDDPLHDEYETRFPRQFPKLRDELQRIDADVLDRALRLKALCADAVLSEPIAGYKIVGLLGQGGMGVVYKAEHLATHDVVAIKIPRRVGRAGFADSLRHFRNETAIPIEHPNIVRILEIGLENGTPYYLMEFVEGGSLADGKRFTFDPIMAGIVVKKLAYAIDAIHRRGIIHCDMKPANVLLTTSGEPKIIDFGMAHLPGIDSGVRQPSGGSAPYMAPEQLSGRVSDLSPATDVYGLGTILYELLAGRPPFLGRNRHETLSQVQFDAPTPITRIRKNVPDELQGICLTCLAKKPALRYPSANALALQLD
jgi:serine/threonine-protein kinase